MNLILVPEFQLEIRPTSQDELDALLEVYRQCEDFLALGPMATASREMVIKDLELSRSQNGKFCGIYSTDGRMIGVLDYVPAGYLGNPEHAFLELLMIAPPYRERGIGQAVVEAFEGEIRRDPKVRVILAGVQVNNPRGIKFWQKMGFHITSGPILHPDQTIAYDLRKDLMKPRI